MLKIFTWLTEIILDFCIKLFTLGKSKEQRAQIKTKQWYSNLFEVVEFALTVGFLFVIIKTFLVQPFLVQQQSMEPTIEPFDYIIVDRFSYRFLHEPARGEVIVFRSNEDDRYLIKRVIGIPNDRVLIENGVTTIFNATHKEGMVLDESYVIHHAVNTKLDKTLGEKEYFVMGDNRPVSLDSRVIGPIKRDQIVGRTLVRLFPFNTISLFPGKATLE